MSSCNQRVYCLYKGVYIYFINICFTRPTDRTPVLNSNQERKPLCLKLVTYNFYAFFGPPVQARRLLNYLVSSIFGFECT